MCGIAGVMEFRPFEQNRLRTSLRRMCDAIAHRGPDDGNVYVDPATGVALGHRRLSIIDLSPTGAQPMQYADGRYVCVFNGEIYGYTALRRELAALGAVFRGNSDTEVLLAAVATWGVEAAVRRLGGMFAFAIYDRAERRLSLARDRLGKKPLYLGVSEGKLAFASELKALRTHPTFCAPAVDREALGLFLRYGYVPSPHCIYRNMAKLPAASVVHIDVDRAPTSVRSVVASAIGYWDPGAFAVRRAAGTSREVTADLGDLERCLMTATEERMIADVPVGVLLSGGVDSSLVAAMMQEISTTPVSSFTVRFSEEETNEADHAARIATHLGTHHEEVTTTPEATFDTLVELAHIYDEPFSDPSQVPMLMVSRLASERMKVILTGDGGDELFGGYARYAQMLRVERLARRFPQFAATALENSPEAIVRYGLRVLAYLSPRRTSELSPDRVRKLAALLRRPSFRARYDSFTAQWEPEDLLNCADGIQGLSHRELPHGLTLIDQMMLLDTITYLADDVLVKVDRASMSCGLEVRSPLLDHRVFETAWRLPDELRFDGTTGKLALKRLLADRVPRHLFDRPKKGFGIPTQNWLRGPLRTEVEPLLIRSKLADDGLLNDAIIQTRWREHVSGQRNWGQHLWTVLQGELWYRHWSGSAPDVGGCVGGASDRSALALTAEKAAYDQRHHEF